MFRRGGPIARAVPLSPPGSHNPAPPRAGTARGASEPLSLRAVLVILLFVVAVCIWLLGFRESSRHPVPPPYIPHAPSSTPRVPLTHPANDTHLDVLIRQHDVPASTTTTASPRRLTLPPASTAASHDQTPQAKFKLVIFTTVKPCDRDAIFDAQIAAVASWTALPLPIQPIVYIIDTEQRISDSPKRTCAQLIADLVPTAKDLVSPIATSSHGTVLLGSAIHVVRDLEPDADMIGFVNADILLAPSSVEGLLAAHRMWSEAFIVGRRQTVDLRSEATRTALMPRVVASRKGRRAPPREGTKDRDPFRLASIFSHPSFAAAVGDRIDAEDYFFFTRNFFNALPYEIPDFHIGRPAYDNWFVHTALHTLQPVIDGSAAIKAYHQAHDYKHLQKESDATAGDAATPGTVDGPGAKGGWTYWGSADQKQNYDLALAHGGWRHGLIEFAPLQFAPGATASATPHGVMSSLPCPTCWTVSLKPSWKPLGNDDGLPDKDAVVLADLGKYMDELALKLKSAARREWKDGLKKALSARRMQRPVGDG